MILEPMHPMAVDLKTLRSVLATELRILPGRALMARVVDVDGEGRGSLSIAGLLIRAELPKEVRNGQELRLVVREVSSDRVLLTLSDPSAAAAPASDPAAAGMAAPPPAPVMLPGGGSVRVSERDEAAGGLTGSSHTLSLRYDAPRLGAVDLRFDLDSASLRVAVSVPSGASLALAQGASEDLRQALSAVVGRSVSVAVSPGRDPLEIYA